MYWWLFALFAGWAYCVQIEINKGFQLSGLHLNTLRSLIAAALMLPLLPLMEWPSLPAFYLVIIIEAAISVVCMVAQYNLAARKSGRVACMHQPIALVLTFLFWLMLDPVQRAFLAENPKNAAGIGLAFIIFIFSVQFTRKNDAGWEALLAVVPIAVLYSAMAVISKLALEHGETLLNISLTFVFLTNIFMFLMSMPVLYSRRVVALIPNAKALKGATLVAFFHTLSWVLACIAIIMTPNPAYVSVITGLAPIWFYIYYRMRRIPDDASPVAGVFMMIASFMVLLFSR